MPKKDPSQMLENPGQNFAITSAIEKKTTHFYFCFSIEMKLFFFAGKEKLCLCHSKEEKKTPDFIPV